MASQIAAGAISGAVNSGNLQGAISGGLSAGLFGGLHGWNPFEDAFLNGMARVAAHGFVGGAMNEIAGGDFRTGFISAAVTQGASQIGMFDGLGDSKAWQGRAANAVAATVVGGTASVAGGGKFANGALTAAFSRLFNDLKCEEICWGERPTLSELNEHWRTGNGAPVYVNQEKVNLFYVRPNQFPEIGETKIIGSAEGVVIGIGDARKYGSLTVT